MERSFNRQVCVALSSSLLTTSIVFYLVDSYPELAAALLPEGHLKFYTWLADRIVDEAAHLSMVSILVGRLCVSPLNTKTGKGV